MDIMNTIMWVVYAVSAIWVIYDVFAVQKKKDTGFKVLWTLLALLFSFITAIIYYFVVKKK